MEALIVAILALSPLFLIWWLTDGKWFFLAGAWLCAFGFVFLGLFSFCLGGVPGLLKRDKFTFLFMAANIVGLYRIWG